MDIEKNKIYIYIPFYNLGVIVFQKFLPQQFDYLWPLYFRVQIERAARSPPVYSALSVRPAVHRKFSEYLTTDKVFYRK